MKKWAYRFPPAPPLLALDFLILAIWLIVISVVYSGFSSWAFDLQLLSISPGQFMEAMAAVGITFFILNLTIKSKQVKWPWLLILALLCYAFFCMISFASSEGEDRALCVVRLGFVACCLGFIGLSGSTRHPGLVIISLRVVLVVVSAINVIEYFDAGFFSFPLSTDLPRAAGFYQNPNISALSIVAALPLATVGAKARLRIMLYCVTLAGIIASESRGGILIWLMIVLIGPDMSLNLKARSRLVKLALAAIVGAILLLVFGGEIAHRLQTSLDAETFARYVALDDDAALGRRYGAALAWQTFLSSPITGSGVGRVVNTAIDGPHNMFLLMLSEFGIVGGVLFAFFMFALRRMVDRKNIIPVLVFGASSLFSHNLFDEPYWAILLSLYWRVDLDRGSRAIPQPYSRPVVQARFMPR